MESDEIIKKWKSYIEAEEDSSAEILLAIEMVPHKWLQTLVCLAQIEVLKK